jgi:senataxin
LYNENGEIIKPNVVRVGILDKDPHELVKQCALENLAQKEMLRLSGASNPRVIKHNKLYIKPE